MVQVRGEAFFFFLVNKKLHVNLVTDSLGF
jgi:hypothetical protein